jgi:hypothetical protein
VRNPSVITDLVKEDPVCSQSTTAISSIFLIRYSEEWDYEWEVPEVQANPNTPRTTSEEDTLGLAPESYPQQKNYTTETVAKGDVDTLIHGLTQTSISDPTTTYTTSTQSYSAQSPYSDQYSSSEPSGGPFSIAVPYNAQSSSPQILPSYASETPYASAPANNAQSHAPQSINWQHHIRTRNPDTDREEFDPSTSSRVLLRALVNE